MNDIIKKYIDNDYGLYNPLQRRIILIVDD